MDYIWDYGDLPSTGEETGRWEQEKFRTLYTVCLKASNDISTDFKDMNCDLIADPATICALETQENFLVGPVKKEWVDEDFNKPMYVGTMGRFKVYRDMFAITNYAKIRRGDKEATVVVKGLRKSSLA